MKKIFSRKRIILSLAVLCPLVFIAGVPLDNNRTILQEIIGAYPSGEAEPEQQQQAARSMNEVWEEVQKISARNGGDSLTLSGTIRLYDNLDDDGIREQQEFTLYQAGASQWMRLDSFDRIQMYETLLLVDHAEKEIVSQDTRQADSLMNALKAIDPAKMKEMLIKDGTTAEIRQEEGYKVLSIKPGNMDGVNEYQIFYDAATYEIKKLRLAYTSFPYQDYMEAVQQPAPAAAGADTPATPEMQAGEGDDGLEIDMNITEYVIEFEFKTNSTGCGLNFLDNDKFKVTDTDKIVFRGKWAGYKKITF
jgi:hypothetical protein